MSLFYDRTRNISGASLSTGFSFDPSYGSTASFTTKVNQTNYTDKISNITPLGLNSVVGEFSLNFPLRKSEAKNLINFYENQSGTGIFPISDGSNIYRTLSGTISSLNSIESKNNDKFDINLGFSVERNSSVLKWSGQSFVNHQFVNWNTGVSFAAYDIVYFENDLEEPCNNFFYCLEDHSSSFSNHPLSTGRMWTSDLFIDTNDQFVFQQTPFVSTNDFNASFKERVNDQKNIHSFDQIEVSYKNISDKKTKALLHFAESRLGYKRFGYSQPQIYDKPKLFFAPTWDHQWNYKNSNNLKINLIEDPLGILPSGNPSMYLMQESGRSSLSFSVTGDGRIFFDTGNGKELVTGTNANISWPTTGSRHQVKILGRLAGFTGTGQSLVRTQFSSAKNLKFLNISGNSVSTLNLYDATGLIRLVCPNNIIGGLDVGGKAGLTYIDYSNNSGSYLNIGGSTNLTGVYAVGNVIPAMYLDSSLAALASGTRVSGYVNFSGSSGVSESSLVNIATLTSRGWNVNYSYTPPPPETPDPSGTPPPSWPPSYYYTVAVGNTHENACSLIQDVGAQGDNSAFTTCSAFNLPTSSITGYSLGGQFYVQSAGRTFLVQKLCCNIASVVSGPALCAGYTTLPPTTAPPSTTTPPPSTTTTPPPTTTLPPPSTLPP